MKKNYSTPEVVNVDLIVSPVMTTTSGEQGSAGIGSGSVGNETPDMSADKRGDWGNLWK